jgi:hypothetical protein
MPYTDLYDATYDAIYGQLVAAFPAAPLDVRADLLLNGTWTGIGPPYIYQGDGAGPAVTLTRGRPDEATSPTPCTAAFKVANGAKEGYRFSPHNPAGAYYPFLGRNTPVRFHIPAQTSRLRMEDDAVSAISTPSSASLNAAGNLQLRLDVNLTSWVACVLASKWSATAGNFSWAWLLNADGTMTFKFSTDGSTIVTAQSTQPLPWPGGRITLIVQYTSSTGAVNFYYATSISGSFSQIGNAVTASSSGALFAGTAAVAIGANTYFAGLAGYVGGIGAPHGQIWAPAAFAGLVGSVYEFRMYAPIGTFVANPVFSSQPDGVTSFTDGQSNVWTCAGTAAVSGRNYRFHGEVSEWPPVWDVTGTDVSIDVTASGPLRRATQHSVPLDSALTRAWKNLPAPYAPVAYWPCEDGSPGNVIALGLTPAPPSGTPVPTQIASGLPGGTPMSLGGLVAAGANALTSFAANSEFACSNPIPTPGSASWTGKVPHYTLPASPAIVVTFLVSVPSSGDLNAKSFMRFFTTGTAYQVDLEYQTGAGQGGIELTAWNVSGTQLFDSGVQSFQMNGVPQMIQIAFTTSGANVNWALRSLPVGAVTAVVAASGTISTATVGAITVCTVNAQLVALASAIGQIAVQTAYAAMDSLTSPGALIAPFNAWQGETAGLRVARLCAEQQYACQITGYPGASLMLGAQAPESFQQLLQECEDADHGLIAEPRGVNGLGYRCSMSLAAQAGAVSGAQPLALTYSSGHLGGGAMAAVDDDQLTINDETVTRGSGSVTGSSFQQQLTGATYAATSAMSVSAPPAGTGDYADQQTINLYSDAQLADAAGWIIHQGTVSEPRYPVIPVDLADTALASIYYPVLDVNAGDYLTVAQVPPWLSPDTVKALVWGLTEHLGIEILNVQWSTRPESPWEVLVAGTGALSDCRADTDGSTLHAAVGAAVTMIPADTAAGSQLWTTAAGDLPFDIVISGERITVTAVTAAAGNYLTGQNTGFEGGNGTWQNTGNCTIANTTAQAHSGAASLQMTSVAAGNMSTIHCATGNILTQGLPVLPGDQVTGTAWFRTALSARSCQIELDWFNSSGTFLSTTNGPNVTDSSSAWVQATFTGAAVANAAFCRIRAAVLSTGGASEVHYTDDVTLSVGSSQIMTVTRSVNGVSKAQSAGAPINLFQPCYAALV